METLACMACVDISSGQILIIYQICLEVSHSKYIILKLHINTNWYPQKKIHEWNVGGGAIVSYLAGLVGKLYDGVCKLIADFSATHVFHSKQ